jgi:ATP-dependent helicase IRC3
MKKTIIPHYYQLEAVESFFKNIDEGITRGILVLPCGAGKNVTTYLIFKRLREKKPKAKMLFMAHRGKLLKQFKETCLEFDPDLQITLEKAEHRANPNSDIILASIQSVGTEDNIRLDEIFFDLIVVDEVHHVNWKQGEYKNALHRFGIFKTLGLGLTATPSRFDKVELHTVEGAIFQKEIYNYSLRKAIKEKYLCDFKTFQFETGIDLDKVKVSSDGDFVADSLAEVIVNSNRNDIIYQKWNEVCPGKKTIAFCVSVEHARSLCEYFCDKGVKAEYITGKDTSDEQEAKLNRLKTGETTVLCNRLVLPEGIDEPSLECVILGAPTLSWPLFVQEIGRLTRNSLGKLFGYLLDFVDNCSLHNPCRVPGIFDLPTSVDMNGATISDLEPMIDLAEKCNSKELLRESPRSLEELKTIMKRIELLSLINSPEEIAGFAQLAWIPVGKDKYRLSAGDDRYAEVLLDSTNNVTFNIRDKKNRFTQSFPQDKYDLETKWKEFEDYLLDTWSDIKPLIDRSADWWHQAPTPAQKRMLTSMKIDYKIYKDLSKGQASKLIAYHQSQGVKPKPKSRAQYWAINKARKK